MLPELCGDIGGNGAKICFGISLFDGLLINLCGEQQHDQKEQYEEAEQQQRKKTGYRMRSRCCFFHDEVFLLSEFVPVSGITLIEGRRLDPLGTYSITNLEESYVI